LTTHVQLGYNPNNGLTSFLDRWGNTTAYGYDSSNPLTSVTDPLNHTANLSYGSNPYTCK